MLERLRRLRDAQTERGLDGLVITDNLNIRYLTGFSGSYAVLLVTGDGTFLLTDSRYDEQARLEAPECSIVVIELGDWSAEVARLSREQGLRAVGFEEHSLSYSNWHKLEEVLRPVDLVPVSQLVEEIRLVKDREEVEAIREAARIADRAFEGIVKLLTPGISEMEIAIEMDYAMRKSGADREAFDTVVASGPRSAMPHGKPTRRTIHEGDLVVIDFGARVRGYHADITRTVTIGAAGAKEREVYEIVLEAQRRAISGVVPGIEARAVDAIARDYITDQGYGDCFRHGLGHGLGLAVHDAPALRKNTGTILRAGMVLTVEPGIYIPGWGGVRIEDDILVTEQGCEVLTYAPKSLEIG